MDALPERTIAVTRTRAAIACVADTHGRPHEGALLHLAALAPAAILHAGDIGDRAVLERLAEIAPVIAVRGNIDALAPDLPEALLVGVERGDGAPLRILLTHIAVNGPRVRRPVRELAERAGASLIVCGHSHVPFMTRAGQVALFNPGSIGPRRFALPIVFGVIELGETIRLEHRDAETGARWLPPG